jgi:hypothetical protein
MKIIDATYKDVTPAPQPLLVESVADRQRKFGNRVAAIFFLVVLAGGMSNCGGAHAQAMNKHQVCNGFLQATENFGDSQDSMRINRFDFIPDDNQKSLWCGAGLNANQERQILKVCKVNTRCQIDGTFSGRGAFHWTKIASVRRLPNISKNPG